VRHDQNGDIKCQPNCLVSWVSGFVRSTTPVDNNNTHAPCAPWCVSGGGANGTGLATVDPTTNGCRGCRPCADRMLTVC
jgi:hypothetical protein